MFSASNREINTKYQIYFRKQQSSLHQIGKLTPNNKFILENNKSNVKNVKEIYICYYKKNSNKQRGKDLPNTNMQDLLQKEDSHWSSLREIFS